MGGDNRGVEVRTEEGLTPMVQVKLGSIRLLSEELINRIAAGEVVERPASVLKEVIENSLDAGADRIEVEAAAGGRKSIEVRDNGSGMSPDDLLLAVERHATSKISEESDLLSIPTLGFRGEALASIGAVSRLTITTAAGQDGAGRQVRMSGGRIMAVEEKARDQGTTVQVDDLFFNVPARRKFLKTVNTEAAHLLETAQRFALSRPELRFVYRHNGQELISTSPREDDRTRLARVLGREIARSMSPFEGQTGELDMSGFLGRPDMDRSRPSHLYLFVNGRPVKDRLMTRAVMEAYRGRLAGGRYPAAVVFLRIDPQQVDVNVHPAKAEVRFRRPNDVFAAAAEILSRATSAAWRPAPVQAPAYRPDYHYRPQPAVAETLPWPPVRDQVPFRPDTTPWQPETGYGPVEPSPDQEAKAEIESEVWRPIGQLHQSYILAQSPEGLVVVDQHAAHERVLFEKLKKSATQGPLAGQALLMPETLEFNPVQAAIIESVIDPLARYGFDLAPFGGGTFILKAVPVCLAGRDPRRAINEILENAESFRPDQGLAGFEDSLFETLACHAAIKAGEKMTLMEMDRLLSDLLATEAPTNCPHGRPLFFTLDRREIEKKFRRI